MALHFNLLSTVCFYSLGETSHFILEECFATYSKAFSVPKTSIYKQRLDISMLRIVQAGLARKYINDELEKVARAKGIHSHWGLIVFSVLFTIFCSLTE